MFHEFFSLFPWQPGPLNNNCQVLLVIPRYGLWENTIERIPSACMGNKHILLLFVRDVEQLNAYALKARGQEKIVNTLVETGKFR